MEIKINTQAKEENQKISKLNSLVSTLETGLVYFFWPFILFIPYMYLRLIGSVYTFFLLGTVVFYGIIVCCSKETGMIKVNIIKSLKSSFLTGTIFFYLVPLSRNIPIIKDCLQFLYSGTILPFIRLAPTYQAFIDYLFDGTTEVYMIIGSYFALLFIVSKFIIPYLQKAD